MNRFKAWVGSGTPWIWLNAAAVSACLLLAIGLVSLIAWRGLGHFWPAEIQEWVVVQPDGRQMTMAGQLRRSEQVSARQLQESGLDVADAGNELTRSLVKTGNRDLDGSDFVWVLDDHIVARARPKNLMVLERTEWGIFIGWLVGIRQNGDLLDSRNIEAEFGRRLQRAQQLRAEAEELSGGPLARINYQLEKLRKKARGIRRSNSGDTTALDDLLEHRKALDQEYLEIEEQLSELNAGIRRDALVMRTADGSEHEINLAQVLDAWRPNAMSTGEKWAHYFRKAWAFLSEPPREANTEGGIFPAIYGTILMVLLMSVFVTPFGVIAALYLKEYARQGPLTRAIRIAVNNLAGVPSIVYGVFGLGFFIYAIGGTLDDLFFSNSLPAPTFGTGGLFWASLTLALLTLPVVIVSTEEGLARIPRSIREGSLALGATQWETTWRTVLPMASPAIMTGVILAVARAAGEVAPLMLVGVVKLAPALPLDGDFPWLHLDRKFMHLGFHIYDVGFQSPNIEASRPLVYATALLLVLVTVLLNLAAIRVRNQLREKYRAMESS